MDPSIRNRGHQGLLVSGTSPATSSKAALGELVLDGWNPSWMGGFKVICLDLPGNCVQNLCHFFTPPKKNLAILADVFTYLEDTGR